MNVLLGENGVGKTQVLRYIEAMYRGFATEKLTRREELGVFFEEIIRELSLKEERETGIEIIVDSRGYRVGIIYGKGVSYRCDKASERQRVVSLTVSN